MGVYRCQLIQEGTGRQCVLMPEHVGKVPCRFTPISYTVHNGGKPVNEDTALALSEVARAAVGYALPTGRQMNKTETRYKDILEGRRLAGEIRSYEFEALTFRLADRCRYTPDFLVEMPDGSMECHEVKGAHIWEDARVKVRVAAARFSQFKFILAQWKKGQWSINHIPK